MKKFVFTDNKKIFNRVLAIALAVIMVIALITATFVVDSLAIANPKCYHKFFLSSFNGSYDAENMPVSYWQVKSLKDDSGNNLNVQAKVELPIVDYGERVLGQIWINVSDFSDEKLEIFVYYGSSDKPLNVDKKPFTLTRKDVKNSKDGWFKIYDFEDSENFVKTSTYVDDFSITFSTGIRVREMVFIDSEYELVKDITVINEYLEGHQNNKNDNPISFAVDESRYFDMGKVRAK